MTKNWSREKKNRSTSLYPAPPCKASGTMLKQSLGIGKENGDVIRRGDGHLDHGHDVSRV